MRRILALCSASAMLAIVALATPASASVIQSSVGNEHAQTSSQDFSARRRHHRYYRHYGYRGYYGAPYYAYEPAPYYYGPRYYYGPPAPFLFWPFW